MTIVGFLGVSIPVFFTAMLLIYIFVLRLQWFPATGMGTAGMDFSLGDNLRHLFLPALSLGLLRTAVFMRYTRASVLEVINHDYIRTARSKGLQKRVVVMRHMVPNACYL